MNKDERYDIVRELIESGRITEFKDIFKYLPKTVMAQDLSTNNNRMTRLIAHSEQFTLEELYKISSLVEVPYDVILELASKQYLNKSICAKIK